MFALRVSYLSGRVYSSAFDEGDDKRTPEWPPHPGRLFSALVAAWAEGGREPQLRPALEWIESRQTPPSVYFGPHTIRPVVRAYVPINDEVSLPAERSRKARAFPSASLLDADVYFVWGDTMPEIIQAQVQAILRRTSYLGHSATLVSVEIADKVPDHLHCLAPNHTGEVRLRVPHAGRLSELERRYERFVRNPSKVNRPSAGRTALYGSPAVEEPEIPRTIFSRMFVLRRVSGEAVPLNGALQLTAALRGALMSLGPQPVPEFISGHSGATFDDTTPSQQPHVAVVPLPFVGSRHATGSILGVAALLPERLADDDAGTCLSALHAIKQLRMSWGAWDVEPATVEAPASLRPETWNRPSRVWATVTPFVFDQYPRDPYSEEAEQIVARAVERVGLPRPAAISVMRTSPLIGVPPASAFPAAVSRLGKPKRFHHHVMLTFREAVSGPVVAGAGRYYGYGLFRPAD